MIYCPRPLPNKITPEHRPLITDNFFTMSNIQEPLKKIFDRHSIVFWYDMDKELRVDYEALDLPDVIKVGDKLQTDEIFHKLRGNTDIDFEGIRRMVERLRTCQSEISLEACRSGYTGPPRSFLCHKTGF